MRRFMGKVVPGVVLLVGAWSGWAGAAVLRVDPNDPKAYATIGEAVGWAGHGSTIVVAAGVYRGDGNRNIAPRGRSLTLRGEGGAERCIIDCEGQGRAFVLDKGRPALVLEGFTLTGGQGPHGGAIAAPTVGKLTLRSCILADNHASGPGGAVHIETGQGVFSNCVFRDNQSPSDGGALYLGGGGLSLEDCTFVNNEAGASGGGLYTQYTACTLRRCAFYGNRAGLQGGATRHGGTFRMSNCTFSGNAALGQGGAVYTITLATVMHCTFAGNTSNALGGAWASDEARWPVDVYGSIFWGNRDQDGQGASAQIYRTRLEAVYSCIQNWPAIPTVSFEDPQFADADGPDGLPGTADDDLSLRPGSPCIDGGFFNSAPWPFDLDGSRRPRLAGKTIDLGAYEFQAEAVPPEPIGVWYPEPVVVSEVLAHSPATRDWVELYNTSDKVIDITGWQIEDQQQNLFTFGPNTRIEPQGYLVVYQGTQLPFGFEARGDWLTLRATVQGIPTGYGRSYSLPGTLTDTTLVRHVSSVELVEMVPSIAPTPGAANAPIAISPVVITEIMYAPPAGNTGGQYVEITNASDAPVVICDPSISFSWMLSGAVLYRSPIPIRLVLPPGGRLLFAQDPNALAQMYPDMPAETEILGPWNRTLPDHAGAVSLYAPNVPDNRLVLADSVTYNVGHAALNDDWSLYWPAANNGNSLQRRSLTAYTNDPNNWEIEPATPGR